MTSVANHIPGLVVNHRLRIVLALIGLSILAVIVYFAKFLRFGGHPDYDPVTSIVYTGLQIVPFAAFLALAVKAGRVFATPLVRMRAVVAVLMAAALVTVYVLALNLVLYAVGLVSAPLHPPYIVKYLTDALPIHLIMFLFVVGPVFLRVRMPTDVRSEPSFLTVDDGTSCVRCPIDTVQILESADHYVKVRTHDRTYLKRTSLTAMEETLPVGFMRLHRRYIVNTKHVTGARETSRVLHVLVGEEAIRVSASYRNAVKQRLEAL